MPPNVSDGGGARSGESSQEYGQSDEFSAVEVSEVSTDAFNQAAARRGKEFLHSQMKQDYYRTLDEFKAAEAELMQRTFEYADAESKVARIKIKLLKILVDMKSFSMDVYANATQTGDPTTTPTRSEARENHREYRQSQNPQPRQQGN
ncbi:uncharacterized protein PpBr36_11076 [Pyricularia pennisetigena]|uniref:uncharacterized protein n=1 Tax=Pyricularia pennisetigena TaxID=1578925 RepID=UPI001154CE7C|nr:uncharacterized protein PpBr36_11076 [Pyricularia pennisetigena]TLS20616.1 hypothetical protein PpBr36_11076 [Pyricularia pennisetigena]